MQEKPSTLVSRDLVFDSGRSRVVDDGRENLDEGPGDGSSTRDVRDDGMYFETVEESLVEAKVEVDDESLEYLRLGVESFSQHGVGDVSSVLDVRDGMYFVTGCASFLAESFSHDGVATTVVGGGEATGALGVRGTGLLVDRACALELRVMLAT